MTADEVLRSLFAMVAITLAIVLVIQLAIGRANFGWRALAGLPVTSRATEPRPYWAAVGMNAIFVLTFGLEALFYLPPYGWLIFLGLFAGVLFEILISGRVARGFGPSSVERADRPGAYWAWVVFHMLFTALVFAVLFWSVTRPGAT